MWILCALFFLSGFAFLRHAGIEGDETLFATAIYPPRAELYSIPLGKSHIPIMLMSYVGALKSWIYKPILTVLGAGPLTMRVPMLIAGTASVYLFFLLLRRIAGNRAAWVGCGILALDSTYLLTVCFDWGPVALQHLLLIGGALLLVRFYQEHRAWALFCGCLLLGLALWDKALAIWLLSGLATAAILALPRQLAATFSFRRLGIAIAGFLLGALPLVIYNAGHQGITFGGNFHRDTVPIAAKAVFLRDTAIGGGLLDWLNAPGWETPLPHLPDTPIARVSALMSALAHHPRHHLILYGFALALLLLPLLRGNHLRAAIFALITMTVAWIQMAITANTGLTVHHTILLWPLPQLVMAVAFAALSRRLGPAGIPAVGALVLILMISEALVTNEYYTLLLRNGGNQVWNVAIYPLSDYLKTVHPDKIVALDWGIVEPLQFLGEGKLPLLEGDEPVSRPEITAADRQAVMPLIADPQNLFIAHTPKFENFPDRSPRLIQLARDAGYRREIVRLIGDGYGRDYFEVYRFLPNR